MEASEFKRVFLPLHHKLYRIAFCLTGNKEDAEDMVQDAYLRIWKRRADLEGIDNLEAFSVTVVKNVCLNMLRNRRQDEEIDSGQRPDVFAETDVGREIESRDAMGIVAALIERLPDRQRDVIRMRDVGDCSFEEIGMSTGLSPGNIRTLLSRARKRIKEQYLAIMNNE